MSLIDIANRKFGYLTVIERTTNAGYGGARWRCRCHCGRMTTIDSHDIRRGHTTSCGCMKYVITGQKNSKNYTGRVFGRWSILNKVAQDLTGHWMYRCRCWCGTVKTIRGSAFVCGTSRSCGCSRDK